MKNLTLLLIIVFLVSCGNGPKKPKDLLSKKEMINLIYDIHLANKTINVLPLDSVKNKNYFSVVSQKYNTDTLRFKASHEYYMHHITEYREIYDSVNQRMGRELKILESKSHLADSLMKVNLPKLKKNLNKKSKVLKQEFKSSINIKKKK